ncbi:metal-dependent transcriptional regulator [bacterium]|nr:metal-dependent transcriptional regulator [bacterium]
MATRTAEQYLKVILTHEGRPSPTLTDVARVLEVSPASVTGMVKRLAAQELLLHVSYGGIELTAKGREIAVRLLRRHRIAESYLFTELDYPLYLVHDEADALEHHMSDYLEERMCGKLGSPRFDPHGHPIPDAEGEMPAFEGTQLSEVEEGYEGRVAVVPDHDTLFLRRLVDIGCVPGAPLTLKMRDEGSGIATIQLGEREESLSIERTQAIQLVPSTPQAQSCFEEFLSGIHYRVQ